MDTELPSSPVVSSQVSVHESSDSEAGALCPSSVVEASAVITSGRVSLDHDDSSGRRRDTDYILQDTYANPIRFNPAYSVVKQHFVHADDTVAEKVICHKGDPRGTNFRRAGPRQKRIIEKQNKVIITDRKWTRLLSSTNQPSFINSKDERANADHPVPQILENEYRSGGGAVPAQVCRAGSSPSQQRKK